MSDLPLTDASGRGGGGSRANGHLPDLESAVRALEDLVSKPHLSTQLRGARKDLVHAVLLQLQSRVVLAEAELQRLRDSAPREL